MPMLRVTNHSDAPRNFPADPVSKIEKFVLAPGGNNVPAHVVRTLEAKEAKVRGLQAEWTKLRASGVIEVASAQDSEILTRKPEGADAPASLVGRATKAAIAIVRVTSDVDVLQMWARKETRDKVKDAIAGRLAVLGVE